MIGGHKLQKMPYSHILEGMIITPIHKLFGMSDDCEANMMIDYFSIKSKNAVTIVTQK